MTDVKINLTDKAQKMAHAGHDFVNHKRKYGNDPYWVHTDEVAKIVAEVTNDEEVIAAAHTHDLIEDVNVHGFTIADIATNLGSHVAAIVFELTDVYTPERFPQLNRAERKRLEAIRLGTVSPEAQTIKVADLISNTASIVAHDKGFARVYLAEKAFLLTRLADADARLLERARTQLNDEILALSK